MGHEEVVSSLAFGPEDDWLASGGTERVVKRWDANTGECWHPLS
ncbi:MAG: hypothetical protein AAF810_07100 [Cyanobacteria bacterium P01_D01_bin.36]